MSTQAQAASSSFVSSASLDARVTSSNSQFHNQMDGQVTATNTSGNVKRTLNATCSASTAETTATTVTSTPSTIIYKNPHPSAVPMKLFAAWEVEKTPANCIPRLCSLTISKLSLNRKFAEEVGSLTIAAKIVSSKRTLRSNEINLANYLQNAQSNSQEYGHHQSVLGTCKVTTSQPSPNLQKQQQSPVNSSSSTRLTLDESNVSSNVNVISDGTTTTPTATITNVQQQQQQCNCTDVISIDLHLTFALQYPHFLKKDGNQLQVLLQRRKRYKNRAILGFKTLAVGCLNLNEVLQRCNHVNKQLDLIEYSKNVKRQSVVASIIMTSVKSSPIDTPDVSTGSHRVRNITNTSAMVGIVSSVTPSSFGFKRDNVKNLNSSNEHNSNSTALQMNDSAELDSDDEIMAEDYSISDASDSEIVIGTVAGALVSSRVVTCHDHPSIDLQTHNSIDDECNVSPSKSHRTSHITSSGRIPSTSLKWRRSFGSGKKHASALFNTRHRLSQRNLKQKFMSLLKKFKITDSETSDSEENVAKGREKNKKNKENLETSKIDESTLGNIEDLEFEFDDSDIDSNSDFGDISINSSPRPGLKPFFSSKSTLAQDTSSITLQP